MRYNLSKHHERQWKDLVLWTWLFGKLIFTYLLLVEFKCTTHRQMVGCWVHASLLVPRIVAFVLSLLWNNILFPILCVDTASHKKSFHFLCLCLLESVACFSVLGLLSTKTFSYLISSTREELSYFLLHVYIANKTSI